MRIVFAGTPDFASIALSDIVQAGYDVVTVIAQPDRPAGRGMKHTACAVKRTALTLQLPVWQPESLRDAAAQQYLRELVPDVMVVAAYGQILPQAVLDIPILGCLNIHASLLPRWRGAAPIHRAIEAGDLCTGITIMRMNAGLDTGDIGLMGEIAIQATDTTGSLHDRLAQLGGELIVNALAQWQRGELVFHPQPEAGVSYAAKVGREDARLDVNEDATTLARRVRAFNPAPGAWLLWQGQPVKIWSAYVVSNAGEASQPGQVLRADAQGIVIACVADALCITELQAAGGKRLTAAQWLAGHPVPEGSGICQS